MEGKYHKLFTLLQRMKHELLTLLQCMDHLFAANFSIIEWGERQQGDVLYTLSRYDLNNHKLWRSETGKRDARQVWNHRRSWWRER